MFVGDSTRTKAREGVLEGFRFAHAGEGLALGFANQFVDTINHPSILLLPIQVILPSFICENEPHLFSFRSTPLPLFNCATALPAGGP